MRINPDLTPAEANYILEVTATDLVLGTAYIGYDCFTGFGLVNAERAMIFAMKLAQPTD